MPFSLKITGRSPFIFSLTVVGQEDELTLEENS